MTGVHTRRSKRSVLTAWAGFLGRPSVYLATVIIFVAFTATVLPAKATQAAAYTPPGGAFDMSLLYGPAQAVDKAESYSPEGRAAYILDRWTFDLAWPAVYGLFMAASWSFGLGRLARKDGRPRFGLLAIPLAGVAFDLAENIAVTALMLAVGNGSGSRLALSVPAAAASAATALKWLFVGIGFAGSIGLPLAGLARSVFGRSGKPV